MLVDIPAFSASRRIRVDLDKVERLDRPAALGSIEDDDIILAIAVAVARDQGSPHPGGRSSHVRWHREAVVDMVPTKDPAPFCVPEHPMRYRVRERELRCASNAVAQDHFPVDLHLQPLGSHPDPDPRIALATGIMSSLIPRIERAPYMPMLSAMTIALTRLALGESPLSSVRKLEDFTARGLILHDRIFNPRQVVLTERFHDLRRELDGPVAECGERLGAILPLDIVEETDLFLAGCHLALGLALGDRSMKSAHRRLAAMSAFAPVRDIIIQELGHCHTGKHKA